LPPHPRPRMSSGGDVCNHRGTLLTVHIIYSPCPPWTHRTRAASRLQRAVPAAWQVGARWAAGRRGAAAWARQPRRRAGGTSLHHLHGVNDVLILQIQLQGRPWVPAGGGGGGGQGASSAVLSHGSAVDAAAAAAAGGHGPGSREVSLPAPPQSARHHTSRRTAAAHAALAPPAHALTVSGVSVSWMRLPSM